jgi:hypothetical protein
MNHVKRVTIINSTCRCNFGKNLRIFGHWDGKLEQKQILGEGGGNIFACHCIIGVIIIIIIIIIITYYSG